MEGTVNGGSLGAAGAEEIVCPWCLIGRFRTALNFTVKRHFGASVKPLPPPDDAVDHPEAVEVLRGWVVGGPYPGLHGTVRDSVQ